jgi:hypothetical protein
MVAEPLDELEDLSEVPSMRNRRTAALVLLGLSIWAMTALGASDTATTNATFVIPSWISLTVTSNANIDFPTIAGPGTYAASSDATLRVLSTKSWTLTESILWGSSSIPSGADETTIDNMLSRTPDITSGPWGLHFITVAYSLDIGEDDIANLPEGTYSVIVQYTATTD